MTSIRVRASLIILALVVGLYPLLSDASYFYFSGSDGWEAIESDKGLFIYDPKLGWTTNRPNPDFDVKALVFDCSTGVKNEDRNRYFPHVENIANQHNLDPLLLDSLISCESAYQDDALSSKGAIGLGQLLASTADELGVDPNNPIDNIRGAAAYLSKQIQRFGTYRLALAAYNAGPNAVKKHGGIPPYKETQVYVERVLLTLKAKNV